MRRMPPSTDRARPMLWCAGAVLLGMIELLGAPPALAGRITILGESESHSKHGPVEVTIDGNRINLSISGDSLGMLADSLGPHVKMAREFRQIRGKGDDDVVSMGHDVVVKADEVVKGDAVSIGGSVRVDGKVLGDAVSIGGGIDLGPDAAILGDAVSIGGRGVTLGPGSMVTGEAVVLGGRIEEGEGARVGKRTQIGFMPAFSARQPIFLAGAWILFFLHLIIIGLIGWALVRIFARRWAAALANLRARAGESLLAGIGAGILYGIVGVPLLLVVTLIMVAIVVGIPLVPLIILLMLIVPVPGHAATAILIGQSVRGGVPSSSGGPATAESRLVGDFWIGHLLLCAPWLLAVLLRSAIGGWLSFAGVVLLMAWGVLILAIAFGWGAILLSRFGRRFPVARQGAAVPVPASPPTPAS